ncbi:hypothetical protein MSG28_013899 [Choristoneura fumiferana]|uniref:Uncharacterized protein n=1 Tax=Choristoneura fumiferana TaxID=7141 RepID=A0ACC0K9U2_CHOFU|nr:hypothetical protein MSG28_013899 [Choristoneura fumiferana]
MKKNEENNYKGLTNNTAYKDQDNVQLMTYANLLTPRKKVKTTKSATYLPDIILDFNEESSRFISEYSPYNQKKRNKIININVKNGKKCNKKSGIFNIERERGIDINASKKSTRVPLEHWDEPEESDSREKFSTEMVDYK